MQYAIPILFRSIINRQRKCADVFTCTERARVRTHILRLSESTLRVRNYQRLCLAKSTQLLCTRGGSDVIKIFRDGEQKSKRIVVSVPTSHHRRLRASFPEVERVY